MRASLLVVGLALAACSAPPQGRASSPLAGLEGTFGRAGGGNDDVVTFEARDGDLLMWPALWSGPMVLRRVTADSFVVAAHPRFGVAFVAEDGGVSRARVHGLSDATGYERLDGRPPRPVRLLLDGRTREAARAYVEAGDDGVTRGVIAGRRLLRSMPSRVEATAAFLAELARLAPDTGPAHAALGDALVAAGDRPGARAAYERALALDPADDAARSALERLGALPADGGWTLPFGLDALLAPPRPDEVAAVRDEWARRDLAPRDVEVVLRTAVDLDGVPAEARVVAHRVHGERHLGVVIVPEGAAGRPVVLEAKGVSPSFFPLEVPGGLTAPGVLGEARGDVVYVAPGYRGERVVVGGDTLTSEGDRSDAWDGATDDAIAFLHAALEVTPEADGARVCAFGRSRGGTVALLAGIREPRVGCVVSWAAPTDWFAGMDLGGWTQAELVADGLRHRAAPGETGGQFIHYFLDAAREGRRGLDATRRHLMASSPLYTAERLPLAQVHWGLEDSIVPPVNGRALVARVEAARGAGPCLDARFHPRAGHDQDRQRAPAQSRAFLLAALGLDGSAPVEACRPASRP